MRRTIVLIGMLLGMGLSACGAAPRPVPTLAPTATTSVAAVTPLPAPTQPGPAAAASPAASPTETAPAGQPAVDTAQAYFDALQKGDYQAAGSLISRYSLLPDNLAPGDAVAELQTQMTGQKWSDLRVLGSQAVDARTVLVHVSYRLTVRDAQSGKETVSTPDEQWPVRQENGQWRYNRGNLVHYHSLDLPAQTTAGLTIQPKLLARYADRMRLVFLAQNGTNEAIVLGQPSEVLAAFVFGDQKVEAATPHLIFDRLRSYTSAAIEVKGWFVHYPQAVEIHRWKNYNEPPWFTFQLSD